MSTKRILIIDDEETNLEVLGGMVETLGHETLFAQSGWEGLNLLAHNIDLVLLDIVMPGIDGFEVLQRIRQNEQYKALPVMMVTCMSSREDRLTAIELGANDFIIKPVDKTELCVRMNSLLKIKEARDELHNHQLRLEKIIEARTAALRESEERYALAVRGANDGLWDWDLKRELIYFSPRWKEMLGYKEHEISYEKDEWFRRIHPDDAPAMQRALEQHVMGQSPHFESEHRLMHKDGFYRWMLCRGLAVRDAQNNATRIAGSLSDIHARKQAEEQLRYDAFHDSLTGLSNRALFMNRLERAMQRASTSESVYAVLFLDLDRFKNVNDGIGHVAGDQLLVAVARRLEGCLTSLDTVARFGGDEFAILLDGIEEESEATRIADRLLKSLQEPFYLDGIEMYTTASVGIAISDGHYHRPEEILRDADNAMYRAKSSGRACYETFNKEMHARVLALLETENDLRRAIEREEFILHYQPIIDVQTACLRGFEALIRWQHPEKGLLSPGRFISVAEDTGLIIPMGWWAMNEACRQLVEWQKKFPAFQSLSMNVNLSVKQFIHTELIQNIQQILKESGLAPSLLKVELTESALIQSPEKAKELLHAIRECGIRLCMDDFGTGYSSLSYLHNFPFDTLKIDRSFVSHITENVKNLKIVKTILSLCNDLELDVVAEGVETVEQLEKLRELHCMNAQGYYFSHPKSKAEIEELLTHAPDTPLPISS